MQKEKFILDFLKKYTDPDREDILEFSLSNGKSYDEYMLKALDLLADNPEYLKNEGIRNIRIHLPYERVPKDVFKKLYNLYMNTNDFAKCKLCVLHSYTDDHSSKSSTVINWDIETIIKANSGIDEVCNIIKSKKLSPLETLAYIHTYVSTIAAYTKSPDKKHDWYSHDQFFAGAFMNMPEVVCLGYASLMKEIIDNLDIPELKCEMITVEYENKMKDSVEHHARCYIQVRDEKYGVDMSCFDDPTWDGDFDGRGRLKYAHFALSNDMHEQKSNIHYKYYMPDFLKYDDTKAGKIITDLNPYYDLYDHSKNKIEQLMIETIYFNMFQKTGRFKDVNELCANLVDMARDSFDDQVHRGFVGGNLTERELLLSPTQADELYKRNLKEQEQNNIAITKKDNKAK